MKLIIEQTVQMAPSNEPCRIVFEVDMALEELLDNWTEKDTEDLGDKIGDFLGVLADRLRHRWMAHSRCPGIGNVNWTLRLCEEDPILKKRLREIKGSAHKEYGQPNPEPSKGTGLQ